MTTQTKLTHEQRVELYVNLIKSKLKQPLNDFIVATMRERAPGKDEAAALEDALTQLGWSR